MTKDVHGGGNRLGEAVRARREAVALLASDLVRMPTPNPPGENYAEALGILESRLVGCGFEVTVLRAGGTPGDSDRYPRLNLVARREGGRPGPTVHFNGHIDVVPAGRGWSVDPWGGEIRDGRVYGRGACDMKGGIAAAVVAVEAFLEASPRFPGAIEISATADEETGGYGGVGFLAKKGFFRPPRVDHVIIPEPLDKHRICLGHRGVWWGELETLGEIAHGSMPFLGTCAIRHMGAVLHAIETELVPALAARRTAMPVVPPAARASTINLNGVHGGAAEGFDGLPSPCVPDSCRLVVDRRFPLEETVESVRAEFSALVERVAATRERFGWRLRDLMTVEPAMTRADAPVAAAVAAAIAEVLGRPPEYVVSPGTYDQKHVVRHGHLDGCIAYGPGRLELAHRPDEFVAIDDMVEAADVMARALDRLLHDRAA